MEILILCFIWTYFKYIKFLGKEMILMEKRVEQQKLLFLSMCSSSDRNKIIGRNSMDIHDFERISYLLGALGFEDYKTSFDMEYKDLLKKLADHIKQAVDQQVTIDAYLLQEQLEILEEWKRNFIERLPNKTMKSYIERLFELCD